MLQQIGAGDTGSRPAAELFRVVVAAHAYVDAADVALQDVLERRAEVAVEARVDDRIEETVGVAEPQKQTAQPLRDARLLVVAERLDERQDEERQPAGGEGAHDDAESLGRLAFVRRRDLGEARLAEEHHRPAPNFRDELHHRERPAPTAAVPVAVTHCPSVWNFQRGVRRRCRANSAIATLLGNQRRMR